MVRRTPRRAIVGYWLAIVFAGAVSGCRGVDVNQILEQLSDARQLAANLLVQFTKSADAANRAVMADTDAASVAFAQEAERASASLQQDINALTPLLQGLGYTVETGLLNEFLGRYAKYRELDRRILDLAVENTNVKGQRLSFGGGQDAADAFRDSLEALTAAAPADRWRVEALTAKAIATVREIQVLQAPHIADADDAVMARLETRMAGSETAARAALAALAPLVAPSSRPRLAAATTSLDRFMSLNAEIIALSRRNTNVRSLALSLDQKRTLTAECEESLHKLRDALEKRSAKHTR
jgi:hypothetical protein